MADVITRLKLESGEYDSKVKRATQGLLKMEQECRKVNGTLAVLEKDQLQYVQSLGRMATVSTNTRGKIGELSNAYTELRMQYNRLTDEEKRGDFGKALTKSLDQLKTRLMDTKQQLADISKEMNDIPNAGGGLFGGDKLSGMLQVFGGNLMTKAAGFAAGLASEMGDMIQQGIELARQGEGVRIAFERLGRGDILDGLREATHGTVTDIELMKAAVKFNDFKLPVEELGTMLAFAQQKAKDTGQSVDYMVDSIVTGLGRKSLMILDNLGLSATEIRERMKETGDMTKAVGAIIRDQMAAAGDYVETAADRAAQANVSLQNKMEELGRKFAPIEEASNQLWTSMKIGILDIIGGPLATLLNQLTEAGRLKNALNDINGDGSSGNTVVGGKLKQLQAAKNSGASQYMLNTMQSSTIEGYNRQIMKADELLKQFEKNHSSVNVVLQNATKQFGQKFSSISELEAFRDAYKVMVSDYQKGASEIMKPVNVNVNTKQAEQNVASLRKQLKELEEQRKKAVKAGDQEQVESLTKQISQTKTNLGYLDPSAAKGAKAVQDDFTEITGLIGNAQERVSDLQKQIRESWDQNEITTLNQKLKDAQNELDVLQGKLPKDTVVDITVDVDTAKALQKIGDIEGVTIAPKNMTVTADTTEALKRVQELIAQVNGTVVEMKVVPVITDEDIERSLREQYGKPIEVPVVPKTTGEALEQEIRIKLAQQNIDADMQTLRTLMEAQIKNGIEGIDIPKDMLISQILGEGMDIPDDYWKKWQDQINEKLKEMDIDPINIDFKTGKEEGKKKRGGPMDDTKKVVSGLNQVASGLQQIGIELPEGVNQVLGVINGVMTILQGISTIIGVTQFAAITANTISLDLLTAAVWANTASSFIPFANGGIVPHMANGGLIGKAAGGMMIPGNSYSGDNLRMPVDGGLGWIGVNSGELILNKSQQYNLASQISGNSFENLNLSAEIRGEQIRLVLNNNGRRTGRGEYVQTNRR